MTGKAVLALNAGSSSIKFALFRIADGGATDIIAQGEIEGMAATPHFIARDAGGATLGEHGWSGAVDHDALMDGLLQWIDSHLGDNSLVAAGHRVVHGGQDFTAPIRVDAKVLAALDALTPLAPLHQPGSLSPIRAILSLRPNLPQVACFDTAFHQTMPAVATRFALPRQYEAEGVRRYGFHGLSYDHIASVLRQTAPKLAAGKVVVAHLGSGASLCALAAGRSVDTTMGFTALDGLVMGTRCGAIDPGVILYLLQAKKMDATAVETLLYKQSGLLGVSGVSSDMRKLMEDGGPHAREAIELFVFQIARQVAAMISSLGGIDGLVFTAGIGEHTPSIRAAVCERLAWLGAEIDQSANARHATRICSANSRVDILVIPANEEATILRQTLDVTQLDRTP
jgi:acetate kinase